MEGTARTSGSCCGVGQAFAPDGGADGGDVCAGSQRTREPVVAASADDRAPIAAHGVMRFEEEAGVIIKIARETRGEAHGGDVESARGHEAEALLECVERGVGVDLRVRRQRPHARAGAVHAFQRGQHA